MRIRLRALDESVYTAAVPLPDEGAIEMVGKVPFFEKPSIESEARMEGIVKDYLGSVALFEVQVGI